MVLPDAWLVALLVFLSGVLFDMGYCIRCEPPPPPPHHPFVLEISLPPTFAAFTTYDPRGVIPVASFSTSELVSLVRRSIAERKPMRQHVELCLKKLNFRAPVI